MKNADVALRRTDSIARGVGMQTQIYVDRALNSEVWDIEGNRYIDFAAGIAVVNTGHRHPKVMAAVHAQLEKFTHTCHQVLPYENYIHLAERLNALVPGDYAKKTVFVTTGAEAGHHRVDDREHREQDRDGHRGASKRRANGAYAAARSPACAARTPTAAWKMRSRP